MKKITKALIATLMAVSTTSTGLMAQNRTYTGPYPLDIIDQYGEGTATYSYIDDYDLGRIYNGPFSLKWGNNCSLSGQYIKDKQDGEWKYHFNEYNYYGHNINTTLTLTFKDGVLNGASTYSISGDDFRSVVDINFNDGKIDGPFSIIHINKEGKTDAFLKGKVVQNYPAIGWEYKPYRESSTETTFRFLGDDPDSPDKIEIRRFDTRTGSVHKDVYDMNRDCTYQLLDYHGIIPYCVDSELEIIFSEALGQIDRLILRESTERNTSTRLSNQEKHYDSDYRNVLTAQIKDVTPVEPPKAVEPPKPVVPVDDNKVYDSVDLDPVFPGGQAALLQYVASHIKYPTIAQENGIQGRVTVQFVVTKTGSVGTVKVVRGRDSALDKEAVRVVKSLPKFTPGKINGQPVNCWYTLPITFKCQN